MAGMTSQRRAVGDYGTPEQEIPATGFGPGVDWESCMTHEQPLGLQQARPELEVHRDSSSAT